MGTAFRTVLMAIASAATTAALFAAGTAGTVLPAAVVTSLARPLAPSARLNGSAIAAVADTGLPPAAKVYEQAAASVVNITSLAVVRTGQARRSSRTASAPAL